MKFDLLFAAVLLLFPVTGFGQKKKPGVVTGTVTDRDGKPVAGATVQLSSLKRVITGPKGIFTVTGVTDSDYVMYVTCNGYESHMKGLHITPNKSRIAVQLIRTDQVYGTITGTIIDTAGKPVAGVRVFLNSHYSEGMVTDSNGRFRMERLRAGDYRIQSHAPRYNGVTLPASIVAGQTWDYTIQVSPASRVYSGHLPPMPRIDPWSAVRTMRARTFLPVLQDMGTVRITTEYDLRTRPDSSR